MFCVMFNNRTIPELASKPASETNHDKEVVSRHEIDTLLQKQARSTKSTARLPTGIESTDLDKLKGHEHSTSNSDQSQSTEIRKKATTRPQRTTKKAPGAPKRFRSAFILFAAWKHNEIKKAREQKQSKGKRNKTDTDTDIHLGQDHHHDQEKSPTENAVTVVGEAWSKLTPEERSKWEELSLRDKERFEREKSAYKGPWKVAAPRKPSQGDLPRKPQPAFLSFANKRRSLLRQKHPNASNGELSTILSTMWREAPESVRRKYLDEAAKKLQAYQSAVHDWQHRGTSTESTLEDRCDDDDDGGGGGGGTRGGTQIQSPFASLHEDTPATTESSLLSIESSSYRPSPSLVFDMEMSIAPPRSEVLFVDRKSDSSQDTVQGELEHMSADDSRSSQPQQPNGERFLEDSLSDLEDGTSQGGSLGTLESIDDVFDE